MSYGGLEQRPDELEFLVGAKIRRIEAEADGFGGEALVLHLETVGEVEDQNGAKSRLVSVQVWQDEEGNGPGYLALTGVGETP